MRRVRSLVRVTEKAVERWRAETVRKSQGKRAFRLPATGAGPSVRRALRGTLKSITSRPYQLQNVAMTAAFLREWCG